MNHITLVTDKEIIRKQVPSIFAKEPASNLSERYDFVDSEAVLDSFLNAGYGIVRADNVKVRKFSNLQHCRHIIVFRPLDYEAVATYPDPSDLGKPLFPEIILSNSSDGKSVVDVSMGIMRLVCTNGLVTGNKYAAFRSKHINLEVEKLNRFISNFPTMMRDLMDSVVRWAAIDLPEDKRFEFAREAAVLRWGEEKAADILPTSLLDVRRQADAKPTLWNTYNVVQENLLKGGTESQGRHKITRRIDSAIKAYDLNRELWDLADGFSH